MLLPRAKGTVIRTESLRSTRSAPDQSRPWEEFTDSPGTRMTSALARERSHSFRNRPRPGSGRQLCRMNQNLSAFLIYSRVAINRPPLGSQPAQGVRTSQMFRTTKNPLWHTGHNSRPDICMPSAYF